MIIDIVRPSIRRYETKLRKTEYWYNCRRNTILGKLLCMYKTNSLKKYGYKLGYSIPINAIGPGLCLAHVGTIVINDNVKIGSNARIHVDVNIGNSAPLGKNHTNNNVRIGANAVVNKDIPEGVTVVGIPAHIISEIGSHHGMQVETGEG